MRLLFLLSLLVLATADPDPEPLYLASKLVVHDVLKTHVRASSSAALTSSQKEVADAFIGRFQYDSPVKQYDQCIDNDDGKGLACGAFAFTTYTGDAALVIQRFDQLMAPATDSLFAPFLVPLASVKGTTGGNAPELANFCTAWNTSASNPIFQQAQEDVATTLYYNPAMALSDEYSLKSPLSKLLLYDSYIQHGVDKSSTSITLLLNTTTIALAGTPKTNSQITEQQFFDRFTQLRSSALTNGGMSDYLAPDLTLPDGTKFGISDDRVQCLIDLARTGNWNLIKPVKCTVDNEIITILP